MSPLRALRRLSPLRAVLSFGLRLAHLTTCAALVPCPLATFLALAGLDARWSLPPRPLSSRIFIGLSLAPSALPLPLQFVLLPDMCLGAGLAALVLGVLTVAMPSAPPPIPALASCLVSIPLGESSPWLPTAILVMCLGACLAIPLLSREWPVVRRELAVAACFCFSLLLCMAVTYLGLHTHKKNFS